MIKWLFLLKKEKRNEMRRDRGAAPMCDISSKLFVKYEKSKISTI